MRRPRWRPGSLAWTLLGVLLLLPALAAQGNPGAATLLTWDPAHWLTEPWRWWGAAWVHFSGRHLLANLAGGLLVTGLGVAAQVPGRAAMAWALAWPLTHLALSLTPELTRYGGLSGVLHAGVAVVAVSLMRRPERAERRFGAVILAVLALKLISETPWRGPLAYPEGWDIAVAPLAHVSGALCGALLAWVLVRPARTTAP